MKRTEDLQKKLDGAEEAGIRITDEELDQASGGLSKGEVVGRLAITGGRVIDTAKSKKKEKKMPPGKLC